MKTQIFLLLLVVAVATSYEGQDVSNLLSDKRFVQKQINCVLDQGHCDAIGRKIRGLLPEALNNQCQRCSPKDAGRARTLIAFMKQNYPREWHSIVQRYAAMRYANYKRF